MSAQPTLSLFDLGPPAKRPKPARTSQQDFEAWLKLNPGIIDLYLHYAWELKAAGHKRGGIGAITERIRWHLQVETRGDPFRLNNNFRSRIVRELIRRDPSLKEFFELRRLRS